MNDALALPPAPFVYRGMQVHLDEVSDARVWWFIDHRGRTITATTEEEARAEIDIMHFVLARVQRQPIDIDALTGAVEAVPA